MHIKLNQINNSAKNRKRCIRIICLLSLVLLAVHSCSESPVTTPPEENPPVYGDTDFFVSVSSGDDDNRGTMDSPLKTIGKAIALAPPQGGDIHVAEGDYDEVVTLKSKVNIWGGYSDGTFQRNVANHITKIYNHNNIIYGSDADSLKIDGLTIISRDIPESELGMSSIAMHLHNCKAIIISNNIITAGSVSGTRERDDGEDGDSGGIGGAGQYGGDGGSGGAIQSHGCNGGNGGDGRCGNYGGYAGVAGSCILGGARGGGGAGGAWGGLSGGGGSPGGDGTNGIDGTNGEFFGAIDAGGYHTSDGTDGTDGTHGSGGGGGGGGGGCGTWVLCGGGGGGGGGGGERGTGGKGGPGGAASIGILVTDTTTVDVSDCTITAGNAGNGSDGGMKGIGGLGGDGGSRGAAATYLDYWAGYGGAGGNGGKGGDGGHGGGGGGGSSIGIVVDVYSTLTWDHEPIILGTAGSGGTHGGGDPAPGGQSKDVKEL